MSPDTREPAPVVTCPGCRRQTVFSPANRWRPFCSERCKTGDLGAWASGAYVIAGEPLDDDGPTGQSPAAPRD